MDRTLLRARLVTGLTALALLPACRESDSYSGSAPPAPSQRAPAASLPTDLGARYPSPTLDLPAARLSERVNGAEAKLRRLGCRRLRLWRLKSPPADLEVLTFSDAQGASMLLVEEVGTDRTPNTPGDEGWIGTNALYFRSNAVLVRLIADVPEGAATLLAAARSMEKALRSGEVAL